MPDRASVGLALAALFAAALCGCASTAPSGGPAAAPVAAAAPAEDYDASSYGLFVAGEAARDSGHLGAAADLLGRAAEAGGGPAFLEADAFTAALQAGDVTAAARLAPADSASAGWRLGVLARGVENLARRRDREAYGLFTTPGLDYPEKEAAELLAPFAAAGFGDATHALANATVEGDLVGRVVGDLGRAELLERFGRLRDAEAAYKALSAGPDPGQFAAEAYAGFLRRRGRTAEAEAVERNAASKGDDALGVALAAGVAQPTLLEEAAQALVIPAAALVQQKDEGLALDYLRLALRLDPASDLAWEMVGDVLAPADPDGAMAAYGRVRPKSPRWVTSRGKLAWLEQRAGEHDDALKMAEETSRLAPADRDAQSTLAGLLSDDSRYADAVAVLTRLIDSANSSPDWRLYYLRASAYEDLGETAKTEADLDAALKLSPDEPELLNFQGYFWIDKGRRLKEALAMVQKAAEAEPRSGAVIDSLGWAYYRLADYDNAVKTLEDAVTLDPSVAEINDHLGDAYWRVDRRLEASFQWRRVLTLDPDAKLKARVEAKLGSPLGPDAPAAAPTASAPTPPTPATPTR